MRGGGGRGVRRVEVRTRFEKKFVDRLDAVVIDSGGEWQQTLVKGTRLSIPLGKRFPSPTSAFLQHLSRFFLGRQTPIRRELVNKAWKLPA